MRTGIAEIKLTVRHNLGNYEHKEIGVTYALGETENPAFVLKELEAFCYGKESVVMEVETSVSAGKEQTVADVVGPQNAPEEVVKEEKAEKTKKASTGKNTTKKSAFIAYNRDDEFHKKEMGFLLDEFIPGWRKNSELKQKAVTVSAALAGKDFLDEEGKILESFRSEVSGWV